MVRPSHPRAKSWRPALEVAGAEKHPPLHITCKTIGRQEFRVKEARRCSNQTNKMSGTDRLTDNSISRQMTARRM